MDQQDKAFMTVFSAVLGLLVLVTIVIFILAHLVVDDHSGEQDAFRTERAARQLTKPGHVVVAGTPAAEQEQARLAGGGAAPAAAEELSGEQLYQQVCASCHAQGLLNSPKPGDTAAWEPRYQQGLDTLVQHVVGGFNQMPPQGQAPGATENNIKAAIVHMLEQSGIELAAADAAPAETEEQVAAEPAAETAPAETEEQVAAEPAAETAPAETEEQVAAEPAAETAPAETEQAAFEAAPAETEQQAAAETAPAETEQQAAAETAPAETEQQIAAETAPAETEEVAAEPAAEAAPVASEQAATETAPVATEETAPVAASAGATAPAATAETEATALVLPDGLDLTQGQQVYDTVCRFCHLGNIPSAPKLGDKEAWAPRAAQGWDTLKEHVLNGFKGMPAKGGRTDMSDEQILNALGYMLSNSQ